MNTQLDTERLKTDHLLVASFLFLAGLGLVTLYSSSYAIGPQRRLGDGLYFITRQLAFGAGGMLLFFIASVIDLERLRKYMKPIVLITIILCALTFVPGVGVSKNGAARWIGKIDSYTYQPSELVKLVLPLYLAHFFDKKQNEINVLSKGIMPPVLITGVFVAIIIFQNNFSTAVFLALNVLFVFFLAGVRYTYFISALVMFLPTAILLILSKEHRVIRFRSFFNSGLDPQGAGYQVRASVNSIVSGGFWGKGIGQGTRKIASVPEIHSDFIFSAYAEELGFLGVFLFCILFGVFAVRGYLVSMKNEKTFYRLLGCGLITMIISQVLLNIAVVAGALPATGIPLPFFSAGGSSLATTLAMVGLIMNVSRTSKTRVYERDV